MPTTPFSSVQGCLDQEHNLPSPIKPNKLGAYFKVLGYDPILSAQLIKGFTVGFQLGYHGVPNSSLVVENSASVYEHPSVADLAIEKELQERRFIGPLEFIPYSSFQLNPLGVVPKKSGSFRLITNLSSPNGSSINDSIDDIFSSVSYASIFDAIAILVKLGPGSFLAKADVKSAFRLIPVDPDQYHLLCYSWRDCYYIDTCLPMGARSSCQIFEKFSSSLEFILKELGVKFVIHYLDDFLFLHSEEEGCLRGLEVFKALAEDIGLPLAPDKTVLPSNVIEFLGYEIDTMSELIRLPHDKLQKGILLLKGLLSKSFTTLLELQSIAGFLNFACAVIVPGRAFMNCFYSLMAKLRKPYHRVRISAEIKKDINVWLTFFSSYNGVSFYRHQLFLTQDEVHVFSDASKSIGFGAYMGCKWFCGRWPSQWYTSQNIVLLEFIPVILALLLWSNFFVNKLLILHIDNEALVAVINRMRSKEPLVMNLVRQLVVKSLDINCLIKAVHIEGLSNILADSLSRLQVKAFKDLHQTAEDSPCDCPSLPGELTSSTVLLP